MQVRADRSRFLYVQSIYSKDGSGRLVRPVCRAWLRVFGEAGGLGSLWHEETGSQQARDGDLDQRAAICVVKLSHGIELGQSVYRESSVYRDRGTLGCFRCACRFGTWHVSHCIPI